VYRTGERLKRLSIVGKFVGKFGAVNFWPKNQTKIQSNIPKNLALAGFGFVFTLALLTSPNAQAEAQIETARSDFEGPYFNSSEAHNYTDPYRGIYRKGDDFERSILREIENARYSIDLAVQELRLPYIAKAIARRRQQDGLRVRIILENQYNFAISDLSRGDVDGGDHSTSRNREYYNFVDMNGDGELSNYEVSQRDAIAILNRSGVPVHDDSFDGSSGSGLMHHKFMIIDSARVLVTSANFTMSDVHGDYSVPESRGNANALIIFNNRNLVRKFQTEFNIMWGDHGFARYGMKKPFRGAQKVNLTRSSRYGNSSVTIQFAPTSKHYGYDASTNGLIAKTLRQAKEDVRMALFVFSDQAIADALQQMHNTTRTMIRVLVENTFIFQWYSEALDMLGLSLLSANCTVDQGNNPWSRPIQSVGSPNLPKGDFLHHKFAVVDDRYTIFGSHNWAPAANHTNDETLLVIDDSNVAGQFSEEFDRLYRDSRLGASPSLLQKIRQREMNCR